MQPGLGGPLSSLLAPPGPGERGSFNVVEEGGQVWEISVGLTPQPSAFQGTCALELQEEGERPRLNLDPSILA